MLKPETLETLRAVYRRCDAVGGFSVHKPFLSVKWTKPKEGEYSATYLDVQWAIEQIRAWGEAIRTDMPMRQVRRLTAKGAIHPNDR